MSNKSGIQLCEAAFERLLRGEPLVPKHVGIAEDKITASIVSVEAGFDKGYLKKSREHHKPLIAKIKANKASKNSPDNSYKAQANSALKKAKRATKRTKDMELIIEKVLTQNLVLVERIKELELELKKLSN